MTYPVLSYHATYYCVTLQVVHSKSVIMTAPGYVAARLVGGDDGVLPEASALSEGKVNYNVMLIMNMKIDRYIDR